MHRCKWVVSVNTDCPKCGTIMHLCIHPDCYRYKCTNGHKFRMCPVERLLAAAKGGKG